MRQATTAKVCLDLAKSGRFTVSVLSTAGFNLPLLALSTICRCPSRSKERSWPRNRGNLANVGLGLSIKFAGRSWRPNHQETGECRLTFAGGSLHIPTCLAAFPVTSYCVSSNLVAVVASSKKSMKPSIMSLHNVECYFKRSPLNSLMLFLEIILNLVYQVVDHS